MLRKLKDLLSEAPAAAQKVDLVSLTLAVSILLLETARADEEFSPQERDHILSTLKVRFSLSPEEAQELIETARARREESLDLWRFTNRINQALDREEKRKVLEEVWRVIYADGTLDAHEDYLVHKLANLLNLRHSELIEAKVKVLKEGQGG